MLLDCESKKEWARDSDHFPVWANIQINKKKKGGTEKTPNREQQNNGSQKKKSGKNTIEESGKLS